MGHDVLIVPDSANLHGAEYPGTIGRSKIHCLVHATSKEAKAKRAPTEPVSDCDQPRGIHYDVAIKAEGKHLQTLRQLKTDAVELRIPKLPWVLNHWLVYWRLHQNIAKAGSGSYLGDSAANWMAEIERCFGDRLALVSELSPWDFCSPRRRFIAENVLSFCFESKTGTQMLIVDRGSEDGTERLYSDDLDAVHKCRDWLFNAIEKPDSQLNGRSGLTRDYMENGFEATVDNLHARISYIPHGTGDHFSLTVELTPRVVLEQLAFVGRSAS